MCTCLHPSHLFLGEYWPADTLTPALLLLYLFYSWLAWRVIPACSSLSGFLLFSFTAGILHCAAASSLLTDIVLVFSLLLLLIEAQ